MEKPLPIHVWAAAPTPLTNDLKVDVPSVRCLVEQSVGGGLTGLFVGGTCGEGLWLPNLERRRLVAEVAAAAGGRLEIAVQVSDNSVPRILDNIREAADAGANIAIIAPPLAMMNATPARITGLFVEAIAHSPLPIGLYDLGTKRPYSIPEPDLERVFRDPTVVLVKDSSNSPARRAAALAAREHRPALRLFNGDEFRSLEYLEAGYDGIMFGGANAVLPLLRSLVELHRAGRRSEAEAVDREMKDILWGIYGGKEIACWLTGLKYFMQRHGVFSTTASYFEYPLNEATRTFIDGYADSRRAAPVA